MCIALYIGADQPPPLVEWRGDSPGFNVVALGEHERVVAAKFSKPHLVYAGAHTGCSCGFRYGIEGQDDQEQILGRASVEALRVYLEGLLQQSPSVELYSCWEGDWEEPTGGTREVTTTHFGGESFESGRAEPSDRATGRQESEQLRRAASDDPA